MKKNDMVFFLTVFWFTVILLPGGPLCQEEMTTVPNDAFEQPRRPQSLFRHEAHNEKAEIEECNECHHVYKDGKRLDSESSEDRRCSDCHGLEKSGKKPRLMMAFHLNCKACHQKRKAGPVMCGECHRK